MQLRSRKGEICTIDYACGYKRLKISFFFFKWRGFHNLIQEMHFLNFKMWIWWKWIRYFQKRNSTRIWKGWITCMNLIQGNSTRNLKGLWWGKNTLECSELTSMLILKDNPESFVSKLNFGSSESNLSGFFWRPGHLQFFFSAVPY